MKLCFVLVWFVSSRPQWIELEIGIRQRIIDKLKCYAQAAEILKSDGMKKREFGTIEGIWCNWKESSKGCMNCLQETLPRHSSN